MNRRVFCALSLSAALWCAGGSVELRSDEPRELGSGIDKANISKTLSPGSDFYEYVNEGWLKTTEIPPDRSNYGAFSVLEDETLAAVRTLIAEAAADTDAPKGSDRQKVGDFYRSYTDLKRRNELGIKPIKDLLADVDKLSDKKDLMPLAARLYRQGVSGVLGTYVEPDARRSDQYAIYVSQAGISLPDRDYYLQDEPRYRQAQEALRDYAADMLRIIDAAEPDKKAEAIFNLETELARVQWTNVANRDPVTTYNKLTHEKLAEKLPLLSWPGFVSEAGFDKEDSVIVRQVSFLEGVNKLIDSVPLETWKAYFSYKVIDSYAPVLTEAIEKRHFEFYETTISGVAEQKPLWRRGVEATNNVVGELVGKLYVE
ncbi:MAG: peptidase M13, partial [Aureliella sp.]